MRRIIAVLSVLLTALWLPLHGADTLRVACIGDSITYGMTISDRENDSYPAQLQRLLGAGYRVANFGKSGATLLQKGHRPYMEQEEFRAAMQWPADIIVIHLGINDTDPRNWPNYRDEFVADYLALIDTLRTVSPDARVIVALLSPIGDRHRRFQSGSKEWHDEIQDAIRTVATLSGAQLIDFHRPLYPYPQLLPDALHPNVSGAGKLAETVYGAITGDFGGLQLAPLYSDGMVLQRGIPLDIHGTADAGEEVTVRLGKETRQVRAGSDGLWCVTFPPREAARGLELELKTPSKKLVFKDVAVGEVWLCSGQSNMEWLLRNSEEAAVALAGAEDPDLRLFDMKVRWRTDNLAWPASALDSIGQLRYFRETAWKASTRETAAGFSAVAYWFGKMLRDSLQVPVGLICNAVGGSPAEAWIDRHTLETQFPKILENWLGNDFIQGWVRERAAKNLENRLDGFDRHPYQPAYLFETGILPLDRYPVKGVIWYQGESNAHNMSAHERLFGLLVDSWRTWWGAPSMPFYYVQLSSMNRPSWPWFRDSQRRLLGARKGLGMAVSSDVGDYSDVHPRRKRPVGERLARLALHRDYGFSSLVPSGPLVRSAVAEGERVVLRFDWAAGLQAGEIPGQAGNDILRGFELAEHDGVFYPAEAEIVGETVVLHCPQVSRPKLVRYGWEPFTTANLYNGAGLPASTFRIDVEPLNPAAAQDIVYTDAAEFPLYGKVCDDTPQRYNRLPAEFEGQLRQTLWNLGQHSAGEYIRFRSDSPTIKFKWENTGNNRMAHMSETGIKGLDLYTLTPQGWRFVHSAVPWSGKKNEYKAIGNMTPQMREYMLYLPLYDGIESLWIGIEAGYTLDQPAVERPLDRKPVVAYGTSILQGGCVSRPGMVHTSIIGRRLDREVINLGFSGSAHLEPQIAEWMCRVEDPGVFVLDYTENTTPAELDSLQEGFFRILRKHHPEVPVVFIEHVHFPYIYLDTKEAESVRTKNAKLKAFYLEMKRQGEKNLFYVPADKMIGDDGEATVDGIHLTDLGMIRYADLVTPYIRKALNKNKP